MTKLLLLLTLLPLYTTAQQVPRRGMLSVMGSYSVGMTAVRPRVTNMGGPYTLNAKTVENPECYDDQGRLVDCNGGTNQLSLGLHYRIANRSQTAGWMLCAYASMQQQTYTLAYPTNRRFSIPVACTPSVRRLLRSNGAGASAGRFWTMPHETQFYVRLGAMLAQHFTYLRGVNPVALPDQTPTRYISAGSGTIIEMAKIVPQNNWLVTPEIGITGQNLPIELAASVQIPVTDQTVFSEVHTFAENNRIVGQNRVDYTNAVFYLTARLGFNLFKSTKSKRTPRSERVHQTNEPTPKPSQQADNQRPTTSIPDPPSVHRIDPEPVRQSEPSRYGGASAKAPVRLKVYFDLTKATLKTESFAELDDLTSWLKANPTVQIRLEGHTDLIGDAYENLILSKDRVAAVKAYLSKRGIASGRVDTVWFGESRPLNRDCPPPNYCPENRRVDMVITNR